MTTLTLSEIEEKAAQILRQAKLSGGVDDLRKLAESFGVEVKYSDPEADEISGMLIRSETPTILINETHPEQRQRFTLAHELGHYFLHEGEEMFIDGDKTGYMFRTKNDKSWKETEANAFAAALLMPKTLIGDAVREQVKNGVQGEKIIEALADNFAVSKQAMSYRLLNLGYAFYA